MLWAGLGSVREAFYLEKDKAAQQAMLDPVPIPTGDPRNDAWLGAVGEHLAQRWGLRPTVDPGGGLHGRAEAVLLARRDSGARHPDRRDTPGVPKTAAVYVCEPLMNAKFPNDRKVRMPFWQ